MARARRSSVTSIQNDLVDMQGLYAAMAAQDPQLGGPPTVELIGPGGQSSTTPMRAPLTEEEEAKISANAEVAGKKGSATARYRLGNAVSQFGGKLFGKTKVAGTRTSNFLDKLPTPGNIALPLGILLLFMLVLLPVNGHTRLMWLWLALTKNAEIGPIQSPIFNPSPSNVQQPGSAQGFLSTLVPTAFPIVGGVSTAVQAALQAATANPQQKQQEARAQGAVPTGQQMHQGTHQTVNPGATGSFGHHGTLSNKSFQKATSIRLAPTHSQQQSHTATMMHRSGFE